MTEPNPKAVLQVLNNAELMSLIFSSLRDVAYDGMPASEIDIPKLPVFWTNQFASWMRINRSFFNASADVLWENMHSLEPLFGVLLPADTGEDGRLLEPLSYYMGLGNQTKRTRFHIYAPRVKSLSLAHGQPLQLPKGWHHYISRTLSTDGPLFPSLQRLFLDSSDDLSLFVAFSAASTLKTVSLYFDTEGDGEHEVRLAYTTCLREQATSLDCLRLIQPPDVDILSNVSRMGAITHLSLGFNQDINGKIDLSILGNLKELATLFLVENGWDAVDMEFPHSVDVESALAQVSPLNKLQVLSITGNGIAQYQIAKMLSPNTLKTIRMKVLPHESSYRHMALLNPTLTIYATRNKGLEALQARCSNRGEVNADDVSALRDNPVYCDTSPLVTSFKGLNDLKLLIIQGLPFFSRNIILEVLELAVCLPHLASLSIRPRCMTSQDVDQLIRPSFGDLEKISQEWSHLQTLQLSIDCLPGEIPALPSSYVSQSRVKHLHIYPWSHHLFPQADSISGPSGKHIWEDVASMTVFARELRAPVPQGPSGN
ncbi:hypothetical protein NMY22_g2774 [Coprinellus aureogranulatus]|nr:hypothetical protein NMY22_g2774 [Coprinellus aureogranulatus]